MKEINIEDLTPEKIVKELDKYIVGQDEAKKAVAIAVRNRWRRQRVEGRIKEEIMPNNIILMGPTGVGKTEIARRLARLVKAPFLKVEATKFTEVGYVGKDVQSMIRDLMNLAVNMVKAEKLQEVMQKAEKIAENKIVDMLLKKNRNRIDIDNDAPILTREEIRQRLRKGEYDKELIEISKEEKPMQIIEVFAPAGMEEIATNLQELWSDLFPGFKRKKKKVTVEEARRTFVQEEAEKLIDMDEVIEEARYRTQEFGIVFIDEMDKIIGAGEHHGPDVSRLGVQRDLLPIVEGTNVMTKYGIVKTDHILFIGAGAFITKKPSDLMPELQGRFPIRVKLNPLTAEDFRRILVEPENALTKQYKALFATEGVELEFTDDAITEIAEIAAKVNRETEDIGARRLHTVMFMLFQDLLYQLPNSKIKKVKVTPDYVRERLKNIAEDRDLSRYIL